MAIKQSTVIPAGFKVTKCPPAEANAKSLYLLRKEEEQALAEGFSSLKEKRSNRAEYQAERQAEKFGEARLNGASISEALDYSNE